MWTRIIFALGVAASSAASAEATREPARAPCGVVGAPCVAGGGDYLVATPPGPGPHPAILFLHGWGGSGAAQMRNQRLVEGALDRGYALIAPTGQPRGQGRSGARWNAFGRGDLRDDVAFLNAVADDAATRFDLQRERMMLAGFSGGGMMSWRVACDAPASFAAYAPIAGLLWRPLPDACAGPVRLLHTHGWADQVVPIEGRTVGGGVATQGDLFAGLALLRRTNACAADAPGAYQTAGAFWRRLWTGCAPGAALELALHAGGHQTPPGWSAMAIDWFEALPPR